MVSAFLLRRVSWWESLVQTQLTSNAKKAMRRIHIIYPDFLFIPLSCLLPADTTSFFRHENSNTRHSSMTHNPRRHTLPVSIHFSFSKLLQDVKTVTCIRRACTMGWFLREPFKSLISLNFTPSSADFNYFFPGCWILFETPTDGVHLVIHRRNSTHLCPNVI